MRRWPPADAVRRRPAPRRRRARGARARAHAPVAGAVRVAAAERVRTAERDDLLVVEAHAVEDVPDVLRRRALAVVPRVRAGQPAVRREALVLGRRHRLRRVRAARAEADVGAAARLDGDDARVHVQVRVAHVRVLALDRLEQRARVVKPSVAAMLRLGLEAHRRAVRAARPRLHVVRAGAVPRETHHHRRHRAAAAIRRAVHRRVWRGVGVHQLHQVVAQFVPVHLALRGLARARRGGGERGGRDRRARRRGRRHARRRRHAARERRCDTPEGEDAEHRVRDEPAANTYLLD